MNAKEDFLKNEFIPLLEQLSDNEVGLWGVLSPQGMIEHMSDAFGMAYSGIKHTLITPVEHLEKIRSFVLSDKPFKENTKNALMPEEPLPLRKNSMTDAINELKNEIQSFFIFYNTHTGHKEMNPFFGELNFEEQLHLLHKHALHHLKQFNLN